MSSFKLNKLGFMVASAALLALAAAQGCSSGDDSQAAPNGGAAGKAGSGNAGSGNAGKTNGEGGSGDTTGEGGSGNVGNSSNGDAGSGNTGNTGNTEAGAGGEAGTGNTAQCTGADGCYSCTPATSIQFENGCVAGGCPDTFKDTLSKIDLVGKL
ncbi:MAG: hypothetical protein ABJB12_10200 [Pseudomonadota bacterium]